MYCEEIQTAASASLQSQQHVKTSVECNPSVLKRKVTPGRTHNHGNG